MVSVGQTCFSVTTQQLISEKKLKQKLFILTTTSAQMCVLCVNAGSAAVEERRGSRLQHLHGDTSGKRGAGSLGSGDLSLPHASASGRSASSRVDTLAEMKNAVRTHHTTALLYVRRSRTSAQKACWEPGCHLSSCVSSRGSAPS